MKSELKKEDAVSPVVGVMLMLVVTIVIAAAVALFASGIADSTEKTPSLSISCTGVDSTGSLVFMHKGGDMFKLDEVMLIMKERDNEMPKEYRLSSANSFKLATIGGSGNEITAGERFKAVHIVHSPGAYVEYALIDLISGNTICTGYLTIPANAKAANSNLGPTYLALSIYGDQDEDWADNDGYWYSGKTIPVNTPMKFYINAYESDGTTTIYPATATVKLLVSKDGGAAVEIPCTYSSGISYQPTVAGSYNVQIEMNGVTNTHVLGATSDSNSVATWISSTKSISFTVN